MKALILLFTLCAGLSALAIEPKQIKLLEPGIQKIDFREPFVEGEKFREPRD